MNDQTYSRTEKCVSEVLLLMSVVFLDALERFILQKRLNFQVTTEVEQQLVCALFITALAALITKMVISACIITVANDKMRSPARKTEFRAHSYRNHILVITLLVGTAILDPIFFSHSNIIAILAECCWLFGIMRGIIVGMVASLISPLVFFVSKSLQKEGKSCAK